MASANTSHPLREPTSEISECLLLYNDQDTDSIKISTKLQETITEVTAKPATSVTTSSPEDVRAEVKTKIHELEAVFVIMTEEMLGESAEQLLEMLHPNGRHCNIVMIRNQLSKHRIPAQFQQYKSLDYNENKFNERFVEILQSKYI